MESTFTSCEVRLKNLCAAAGSAISTSTATRQRYCHILLLFIYSFYLCWTVARIRLPQPGFYLHIKSSTFLSSR